MSIQFNYKKLLANLFKYALGLAILTGLAWGGYELYMQWTNTPFNVRVTNITARSLSVTWLTDRPSTGEVVYSDSVDMGLLSYQALKAYDDRDVESALAEAVSAIDTSGDEVELPDLFDVEVTKKGKFYVHHVTLTDLTPEESYYFKIKGGVRTWGETAVGTSEAHNTIGVIENFIAETGPALKGVPAPSPAYGTILSIQKDDDGEFEERETDDGLIFYRLENVDEEYESEFMSAVTNSKGGWTVDRSNAREGDGTIMEFEVGKDLAIIFANVENSPEDYQYLLITGIEDEPAPAIIGDSGGDEEYTIVKASLAQGIVDSLEEDALADDKSANCDGGCHNGWEWKMRKASCDDGEECDDREKACKKSKRCSGSKDDDSSSTSSTTGGQTVGIAGCVTGALGYNRDCESAGVCSGTTPVCYRDCDVDPRKYYCVKDNEKATGPSGGSSSTGKVDVCLAGSMDALLTPDECTDDLSNCVVGKCDDPDASPDVGDVGSLAVCMNQKTSAERADTKGCYDYDCLPAGVRYRLSGTVKPGGCTVVDVADDDPAVEADGSDEASDPDCLVGFVCNAAGDLIGCQSAAGYIKVELVGGAFNCVYSAKAADSSDDIDVSADLPLNDADWKDCCYSKQYTATGTWKQMRDKGTKSQANCNEPSLKTHWGFGHYFSNIRECSAKASSETLLASSSVLGVSTASAGVSDGSLVVFPESGIYEVTLGGETFNVIALEGDENTFYKDINGIPGYQAEEDTLIELTGVTLDVEKKVGVIKLALKEGVNLVSFPYLPVGVDEKTLTASEFLNLANLHGIKVSRISFFEDGKWQSGMSVDPGVEDWAKGRDFDLLPGRGYVVLANSDTSVDVPGKGLKSAVPVALSAGWNLTGVNGFTTVYTARTLIESINSVDELTADNVTWWPTSKGRYEGFQVSEGTEYGFDYPISDSLGYFIRISDFSPTDPLTKSILWGPGTDLHGLPGSN